jgi:nicotinamide-nucleotide amidase
VAYSNAAKVDLLAVPPDLIERHGAVSRPVARAMARGIRRRARADLGLAVTGIAGPAGGSVDKPVGLVFIALDSSRGTEVRENRFLGMRQQIKLQSAQKALDMVRRQLLQKVRARKRGIP